MKKSNFRIVLIGVEFEENLSIRYLGGALQAAGYEHVRIQSYNSLHDAEIIAAEIVAENAHLVGISMAFQVRAIDDMTIVQLLRKQEFTGHITAGGQFATLHYHEIFSDCGLNSMIRFEAETSIVTLADTLREGKSPDAVPGLVWKNAEAKVIVNSSTPAPGDIDALPLPLRKGNRPGYLGLKSIQLIGSRGCHATCKYCCVSALATERRTAARESGAATALPGTRRRSAVNVAEEIAHLYFVHDIRIFDFQDDNWIPPKLSAAVDYFTTLKQELDKRGVGRIGLTLKTRADSVHPDIIRALKAIGLVRVFIGIESGTQSLLSKLGRKSRENISLQALHILREERIPAYFNALLFGPDIRFEDIAPELEFLEQCTDFPFEVVEVVIYGKTGLYHDLQSARRLHGNYLDYDYDYLDAVTQRTHTIISRLETRHFGIYSPVKMAADLGFNLGVMQVFYPGAVTDRIAEKVTELNRRINSDQVRVIRKAAELAANESPVTAAVNTLIAETVSLDLQFYREIIALHQEMEMHAAAATQTKQVSSYYRLGAIVQSGLVASLFLLLAGEAQAGNASLPSAVEWVQPAPGETAKSSLPEAIDTPARQKVQQDYDRLRDLLHAYNPKIKIASTLNLYLDEQGEVADVDLNGSGQALSPLTKQVILDLLRGKKFYAFTPPNDDPPEKKKKKKRKLFRKKRSKRAPLD